MPALEDRNNFVDRVTNPWLPLTGPDLDERRDGRRVADALYRRGCEGTDMLILVVTQQSEDVVEACRRLEVEHAEEGPKADIG